MAKTSHGDAVDRRVGKQPKDSVSQVPERQVGLRSRRTRQRQPRAADVEAEASRLEDTEELVDFDVRCIFSLSRIQQPV